MTDDIVAQHPLPTDPEWFSEVPAGQHYTLGRMAEVLRESGCIVLIGKPKAGHGEAMQEAAHLAAEALRSELQPKEPGNGK